jgi:hypothetical protein
VRIIVKLDDSDFVAKDDVRKNLLFPILWEHAGDVYPRKDWIDFGCIIIGWWVTTVVKFLRGHDEGSFSFMDGPYALLAKFDRQTRIVTLHLQGTDKTWYVNIIEIMEALSQNIDIVYEKFEQEGVGEYDKEVFRKYTAIIQNNLLELRQAQFDRSSP